MYEIRFIFWAYLSSGIAGNDNGHNHTVKTEGASKNFDDKHLHEGALLLGVDDGSTGSDDADAEAAHQVREAHHEAGGEDHEALPLSIVEQFLGSKRSIGGELLIPLPRLGFSLHEDSNNNSVNGNGLAEDDAIKV